MPKSCWKFLRADSNYRLNKCIHAHTHTHTQGFPGGPGGKEPTCQCRRHKRCGFNPWVEKIPWKRKWQPPSSIFGASLVAQQVKNLPVMWETWFQFLSWKIPGRRERLPTPVFWSREFHGLYSPRGRKELDTTEWLSLHFTSSVCVCMCVCVCIYIYIHTPDFVASLVDQLVKNLPAIQETWVWSLGWKDPPEKGMATHSSILAWRMPWTEETGGLQFMGLQRVRHDWLTQTFDFKFYLYHNFTSLSYLLHGNYLYHILPLSKIVCSPHIERKKVTVTPIL